MDTTRRGVQSGPEEQMKSSIHRPVKRATKVDLSVLACTALTVGLTAAFSAASAAPLPAGSGTVNPYSPAAGHPYRHGVVPTRSVEATMRSWAAAHRGATAAPALAPNNLN